MDENIHPSHLFCINDGYIKTFLENTKTMSLIIDVMKASMALLLK
jgi:hypothetical protein